MIPWWWILIAAPLWASLIIIALAYRVAVVRLKELETACDSAYANLRLAADPSMDQPTWLDFAGETLARAIGREWN